MTLVFAKEIFKARFSFASAVPERRFSGAIS
jgi:hypothetical protein